jgi:hypothetical protein
MPRYIRTVAQNRPDLRKIRQSSQIDDGASSTISA